MNADGLKIEEENVVFEKEESDDNIASEHEDDESCAPKLPRTLSMDKVHHSGEPFPIDLLARFQEDLSKQDHFKEKYTSAPGKNCYGPARPEMTLNVHSEDEDRRLVVLAARFYNKLKTIGKCCYAHHHHPDWLGNEGTYGVDCSNFTSHLFNLCLGVRFTSAIGPQSQMDLPKVNSWSALRPGDLAFFRCKVGHVGICVEGPGNPSVIHSTSCRFKGTNGPSLASNHKGWPINNFMHGFRFADVRKLAAEATMSARLKAEGLTQTELQRRALDGGISQDRLDKAVGEAVKIAMIKLIVETAVLEAEKQAPSQEVVEDASQVAKRARVEGTCPGG